MKEAIEDRVLAKKIEKKTKELLRLIDAVGTRSIRHAMDEHATRIIVMALQRQEVEE